MSTVTLHEGDNRDHLRRLIDQGVRVHSVVCDPPYGLVSIAKRFGAENAAPAKFGNDGAFARASSGFMGSKWDASGIERDPEFWHLIWEILLPGGFALAFSSSRTYHRMACAIEDAGFITHPMFGWLYASGFPKAHNAAMAIDKVLGQPGHKQAVGEPVRRIRPGADQHRDGSWEKLEDRTYQPGTYVPGSAEGEAWNGWHYGAQTTKPALEPIYIGQKPFSEKNGALNLLKHGVGALNIEACRVPIDPSDDIYAKNPHTAGGFGHAGSAIYGKSGSGSVYVPSQGRWPANLLHDGSDIIAALFPDHAERFFNAFHADDDPIFYHAKANKIDRAGSKHPTVKPITLMRWLCRLVTPTNGVVLDPFAGSGTTGAAAQAEGFDCILMEAEPAYAADIRRRLGLSAAVNHFESLFDDSPNSAFESLFA